MGRKLLVAVVVVALLSGAVGCNLVSDKPGDTDSTSTPDPGAGEDASWPSIGYDARHTRRSSVVGPDSPELLWQSEDIYNCLAIAGDGTIYAGASHGRLYAFNPDGTEKWFFESGAVEYEDGFGSPAITPEGVIYVGRSDGNLYAINPDGTERWSFKPGEGVSSSPALAADGTIYIGAGGQLGGAGSSLYAVNPDGTAKWSLEQEST